MLDTGAGYVYPYFFGRGVSMGALTVGMSWSPLMLSTGVMMGIRTAASMALGSALAWLGLAPWLVRAQIVKEASFSACSSWLVWPALGLLLAGSFLPLILDWRSVVRSLRDLGGFVRRRAGGEVPAQQSEGAGRKTGAAFPAVVLGFVAIAASCIASMQPLDPLAMDLGEIGMDQWYRRDKRWLAVRRHR